MIVWDHIENLVLGCSSWIISGDVLNLVPDTNYYLKNMYNCLFLCY